MWKYDSLNSANKLGDEVTVHFDNVNDEKFWPPGYIFLILFFYAKKSKDNLPRLISIYRHIYSKTSSTENPNTMRQPFVTMTKEIK